MRTDILTNRRVSDKLQQPAMVLRQLEFSCRTQHALTFHAAQLPGLDDKWLAIFARRQFRSDERTWHLDADAGIECTADDIEQIAFTHID